MEVKTTTITKDVYEELDFYPPANFYIVDALSSHVYFHCRGRDKAQQAADEMYGKGKYKIRVAKMNNKRGDVTAK